jgi:cytochrome o ubiquinol oxidase subunit IV
LSTPHPHADMTRPGFADAHVQSTRRGYRIGSLLSILLTAVPFWLVMSGVLQDARLTAAIIFIFAAVQVVVHVIYFLHLDVRSEGGWTLVAFLFTVVIVALTIGGSVWVMYHLNANMMPMPSNGMNGMP